MIGAPRLLGRFQVRRFRRARFDRRNGIVRRAAVGTATLRHVGPPAAALPAQRCHRRLDEVDRTQAARPVVGHARPRPTRGPSFTATSIATPLPTCFLSPSTVPRSSLGSSPSTTCATNAVSPTCSTAAPLAALPPPPPEPPRASAFFRVGQLAFGLLQRLGQLRNARRNIVGRGLERRRRRLQRLVTAIQPHARGIAGQRLDTPHARRDRAFADDLQQGDVAQRPDVRPPQSSTE